MTLGRACGQAHVRLSPHAGASGARVQQARQPWVRIGSQRIDDGQAPGHEAILHVLGEQQGAARIGCGRDDQRVPELQLVIDHKVRSREYSAGFRRCRAEGLAKLQQDGARLLGTGTAALEDHEQFTQRLGRGDQADRLAEAGDDVADLPDLGFIGRTARNPGQIGEDIGIERDAGHS